MSDPQLIPLHQHSTCEVQEELLARIVLSSRVLWQLWHQPPSAALLADLEIFLDEWPLAADRDDVKAGLATLRTGLSVSLAELNTDYADLFVGPNALKAPPWGSVYLNEEQLTFGETTLEVRAFFHQHGMAIETGEQEPDDHLGLMFAFLAWLGESALEQEDNQSQAMLACFASIRIFLSEHLLPWAPRLCELVEEQASTAFYQGVGQVTHAVIAAMADITKATPRPMRLYR